MQKQDSSKPRQASLTAFAKQYQNTKRKRKDEEDVSDSDQEEEASRNVKPIMKQDNSKRLRIESQGGKNLGQKRTIASKEDEEEPPTPIIIQTKRPPMKGEDK